MGNANLNKFFLKRDTVDNACNLVKRIFYGEAYQMNYWSSLHLETRLTKYLH